MTDTKTTIEPTIEGSISTTISAVPGEDLEAEEPEAREPTLAEEITAAILGGLGPEDDLIPAERLTLAAVEAVLAELDARKARERIAGHIDIEAVVDDLELGDLRLLEKTTGQKLSKILSEFETSDFGADTIVGIVLVALRRDNPEATIEDADKIKLAAIAGDEEDEEGDEEEDEEADPR